MISKRLPSFNDFSPGIIGGDLRPCLKAIVDGGGVDKNVIDKWANLYFDGVINKRSSANIPATLRSTGLILSERPITLSEVGHKILNAKSGEESVFIFCSHLLKENNGKKLLIVLREMKQRSQKIDKKSLQYELARSGVEGLANATTDHTTLKNWLIVSKFILPYNEINDDLVKKVLGISTQETDDFFSLTLAQQVYLNNIRRCHLTADGPFPSTQILTECIRHYPSLFDASQFAKKIKDPLEKAGWITVGKLASGPQGGKSGLVQGTDKLISIPVERMIPDFNNLIPGDLRSKLKTPPLEILRDLYSSNKYNAGLALELLALRMTLDLGLNPRSFRLRSAETAHAEVDLVADCASILFSRWTIQCKCYEKSKKVSLSEVAKEVGIAVFSKAHVVVVVTTSGFTKNSIDFAREVSLSQNLQFLLIPGEIVDLYLKEGKERLFDFVQANAKDIMNIKRRQVLFENKNID